MTHRDVRDANRDATVTPIVTESHGVCGCTRARWCDRHAGLLTPRQNAARPAAERRPKVLRDAVADAIRQRAAADVVGRSPLRDVNLAEAIRRFLFGRGISSVEVLQGPTAKRPLLVFPTGTEGPVFKALSASATTLLHVRDTSPGAVDAFENVCRSPDGGSGGRFTMTPAQAQELVARRIEMPAYYVRIVQF